jgi:hypothetical protein
MYCKAISAHVAKKSDFLPTHKAFGCIMTRRFQKLKVGGLQIFRHPA